MSKSNALTQHLKRISQDYNKRLSPAQRSARAKKAAQARWQPKKDQAEFKRDSIAAVEAGIEGMQRAQDAAEKRGFDVAQFKKFVLGYLKKNKQATSEMITLAARNAGILRGDARATGGSFKAMINAQEIRILRCDLPRKNGHGALGAKLYELAT